MSFKNAYVPILFNEIFVSIQVQSKTEATEFKLSISTGRSLDLERELDELQKKTVETSSGADQTQRQTDDITAEIEHTERVTVFDCDVLFIYSKKGNLHIR